MYYVAVAVDKDNNVLIQDGTVKVSTYDVADGAKGGNSVKPPLDGSEDYQSLKIGLAEISGKKDGLSRILSTEKNAEEKIKILHTMGVETIYCPDEKNQIDLKKLMADLGNRGIDSILLEGGGTLNDSALRAGIVKEVQAFVAPKLFGGVAGKTPVEGIGVELPSEAVELKYTDICQIGEDIRIRCQVCEKKQEESCLQES